MKPPNPFDLKLLSELLKPWRRLVSPVVLGLENVPANGPMLFVGNHTVYALLDIPILLAELYQKRGVFPRALGDHAHFKIPLWRDLLTRYGVVDGTRANCSRLMEAGEPLLVFPGGGREVMKRRGEKYKLLWKERMGFARMAIQHRYTIVPFSAVGADDALDILLDANDLMASPLGGLVRRLKISPDDIPPLVRGIGLTPIPRPERLYFRFGPPIDADGDHENVDQCRALRDQVRDEVDRGIAILLSRQKDDPDRKLIRRLFKSRPAARRRAD
jgi:1-acyl-sn-glycerol-3-phosphate acyltransferase